MTQADLARLWEEHTRYEFATRDTEATLATMVDDAYVNHIPVLTGGAGKAALRAFYSRDFIPSMPPDTTLTPVSRTIGENQIVDEMIFSFTHTQEMPWMLPEIPPTNRRVEIPLVAIVRFRDGKLAHEHIYWDQASVLKQIGLLDATNLPVFGVETARKVLDPLFRPQGRIHGEENVPQRESSFPALKIPLQESKRSFSGCVADDAGGFTWLPDFAARAEEETENQGLVRTAWLKRVMCGI